MTDGVTVTSLPASLLQKISATMDCLCQVALNRKLSHKFEKLCKFSSHVKAKSRKTKLCKTRTTCSCTHCIKTKVGRTGGFKTSKVRHGSVLWQILCNSVMDEVANRVIGNDKPPYLITIFADNHISYGSCLRSFVLLSWLFTGRGYSV
jgi:hypothetical protein